MPNPPYNRWSPETVERAGEVRTWMDTEAAAGRMADDDEVWAFVTERWPTIPTGHAEHVLNLAMNARAASRPARERIAAALKAALLSQCDGTLASDDPADWSLVRGVDPHGPDVASLIDALADHLSDSLGRDRTVEPFDAGPAPGR